MSTPDVRTRRTLLVLLGLGTALWAAATIVHRSARDAQLGGTVDERVAAVTRALPVGTTLDSARRFLRAHRIDFAQGQRADAPRGEGVVLDVFVSGEESESAIAPAARLQLEFDARRRLAARRVSPLVVPRGRAPGATQGREPR